MAQPGKFNDEDEDTFWEKYRAIIIVSVIVMGLGGFVLSKVLGKKTSTPARSQSITMVTLPPLPPPPKPLPTPPPQATPPPVDQKMEEQRPMEPQEAVRPDEPDQPKPDTPPDQPLGTNNVGDGPGDNFGLGGPGGNGGFGGGGKAGGGGSKYGFYAGQVQRRITDALQRNPKTKSATMRVEVRIWPDLTGRITRAEMKTSTGDPALDSVIQSQVLKGLQLDQPPPAGMPLPIVLRLTAKKAI